jgi:hypothetical protein
MKPQITEMQLKPQIEMQLHALIRERFVWRRAMEGG